MRGKLAEFSPENIDGLHGLLAAMAGHLAEAAGVRVIRTARIAGQFAKPRSRDLEEKGGEALPMYRGDIVNGIAFDPAARTPDPQRMFRAYAQSGATLSHLKALEDGVPTYTCHERCCCLMSRRWCGAAVRAGMGARPTSCG
jgi:3-deoxy-7-phosphoheptulonate synthase